MSARPENHAVNVLRTAAALVVVVGHLRVLLFQDYEDVPHTLANFAFYGGTSLGHQAVVVFFVLSGYWVGGSVLRSVSAGRFSWRKYGVQRGVRLWIVLLPALLLTLVADSIGRYFFADHSAYQSSPEYDGVVSTGENLGALDLVGNAGFLQTILVEPYGTNTALWSLAYEFWFYALFPCLVIAVARRSLRYGVLVLVGLVLVGPQIVLYMPMWCMGAAVAHWQTPLLARFDLLPSAARTVLRFGSAGVLVVGAVVARGLSPVPTAQADYAVAGLMVLLLVTLLPDVELDRRASRWAVLRLSAAAHWSYTLYAVHLPLCVLLVAALDIQVEDRWSSDPQHWVGYLALSAVPVALAYLLARPTEMRTAAVRARIDGWAGRGLARRP